MPRRRSILAAGLAATASAFFGWRSVEPAHAAFEVEKSDEAWKKALSPEAYRVLRHEATEAPFTSPLTTSTAPASLPAPAAIFPSIRARRSSNSGTGWPSFWQPLPDAVGTSIDHSLGLRPHRGPLPTLRRPSRPRLRRRAQADRAALLHERRRHDFKPGCRRRLGPPDRPARRHQAARTSCTSGTKWRSRFWMPLRSVAVDEGQPEHAPFMDRYTTPC